TGGRPRAGPRSAPARRRATAPTAATLGMDSRALATAPPVLPVAPASTMPTRSGSGSAMVHLPQRPKPFPGTGAVSLPLFRCASPRAAAVRLPTERKGGGPGPPPGCASAASPATVVDLDVMGAGLAKCRLHPVHPVLVAAHG